MKPTQQTMGSDYERHTSVKESDIYYTPQSAIASLLFSDVAPPKSIPFCEPAAGSGAIVKAMLAQGYRCGEAIEIRREEIGELLKLTPCAWVGDFLDPLWFVDGNSCRSFVTNPPFSLGSQFWIRCRKLDPEYIAFLLRCNTLGSNTWFDAWDCFPPTFIRSLRQRPSFTKAGKGTDAAEYAWIGYRRGDEPLNFRMV